jgi:hypothetical protein
MSVARRKLTMQLTPLLDLLLIVIFAQYMEMRDSAGAATESVESLQQDLAAARSEVSSLQVELTQASRLLDQSTQTVSNAQTLLERQRAERAAQELRLEQSVRRQQLLGRLMVDLFQIPPDDVAAILDPERNPSIADSSPKFAQLRQKFQQMAAAEPQEMIRHLLTFDEVQKHCDIWELQLHPNPRELTIQIGGVQRRFILPLQDEQDFAPLDGAAFERELYTQIKSLPQPKALVLVTLTYEFDVRENLLGPAKTGIAYVIDRLRVESAGRSQFEFAELGILEP